MKYVTKQFASGSQDATVHTESEIIDASTYNRGRLSFAVSGNAGDTGPIFEWVLFGTTHPVPLTLANDSDKTVWQAITGSDDPVTGSYAFSEEFDCTWRHVVMAYDFVSVPTGSFYNSFVHLQGPK